MPTHVASSSLNLAVPPASPDGLAAFAAELDQIRADTMAKVGSDDARYIIRLLWVIRGLESLGRLLLIGAPWLPTWWLGAAVLCLAKCLENMEFGHNVMHGQYDWMNDPRVNGKLLEWDMACTGDDWRSTHNHEHHIYTNVLGKDRDFGYGMLRLTADVPWEPRFLAQVPYALLLALLFEWGIGTYGLELERLFTDRQAAWARIKTLWPVVRAKMWRQIKKDYVLWPVLGGLVSWSLGAGWLSGWSAVLLGNVLANLVRNLWLFAGIFCSHFAHGVCTFDASQIAHESRGQWYWRQIRGSANIEGGKLLRILTGHLTNQIEHHLFPDMPARRCAQIAPQVREVCLRHGVPYNMGTMWGLLTSVAVRIVRHSWPGGERTLTSLRRPG
ncbi:MAG: acyl-CoA desaturase [Aquabacterium sp.]